MFESVQYSELIHRHGRASAHFYGLAKAYVTLLCEGFVPSEAPTWPRLAVSKRINGL